MELHVGQLFRQPRSSNKLTGQDRGAAVFSQKRYESGITKALRIDRPIEGKLQEQIQNTDHLDALQQLNTKFEHLSLGLQKIWSFYEAKETMLRVKLGRASAITTAHDPEAESGVTVIASNLLE